MQKIVQNFEYSELDNGIRIVSEQIPYVQSFSLGFWFNVGTRDEQRKVNGISHFIEHMLFKGTKKRSARAISETIESFGGYLNAFTSKEHTCYYGRGLAQHLPKTLDVIADMIQHPLFRQADIRKEAGVILDELKDIDDNPEELIFDKFEEIIFKGNPLALPIVGNEFTIASFDHKTLSDFHKSHYGINNLLITASGNIDHKQLIHLAEKHILSPGKSTPKKRQWVGEVQSANMTFDREISQVHCILGTKTYGYRHEERMILNLLSIVLGEGSSSRLYQAVREKTGITYQINSFINSYYDASAFGVYFSTNERNFDKALLIISKEMAKLRSKKIGDRELRRVKEYLKGTILLGMENTTNRMIRLANSIMNYNRLVSIDEVITKIEKITAEQILEMACEVLNEDSLTKVILKSATRSGKA